MEKEQQFQKRIRELCQNAYQRDIITFTDFLDLNELHMVNTINYKELGVTLRTYGGYDIAERQMAAFIPDALSYDWEYPMHCLIIRPLAAKFAEELSHRDYLGAVVNLGIDRGKIGDILVGDKEAWLFCHETMTDFLIRELCRIRHTQVIASRVLDSKEFPAPKREEVTGTVASVRLDAVLALAFHTSRSQMLPFIEGGKVFVNGKLILSNGYSLKPDDIISVRGKGKFQFSCILNQTKKNRYSVMLYRYQ